MSIFQSVTYQNEFDVLYGKAVGMKDAEKLVQLMYQMIAILKANDIAYETEIPPMNMGVHPSNRTGKKIVGLNMQKKGLKIVKVGFRKELCGPLKAIAMENNPTTNTIDTYTMNLAKGDPLFAQYVAGTIRGGSMGCGHLNQFLAATAYGAKTPHTSELSDPGRDTISKHRVCSNNDHLSTAVEKGIKWTMINFKAEERYPQLPHIIQRALNIEHHVGEGLYRYSAPSSSLCPCKPTCLFIVAWLKTCVHIYIYIYIYTHTSGNFKGWETN